MLSLELPSTHRDNQEADEYWGLTSPFQHRKAKAESRGKPTFHPLPAQEREFLKQVSTTACQGWGLGWGRRGQQNLCASVSIPNPEKQTKWHTTHRGTPTPSISVGFLPLFLLYTLGDYPCNITSWNSADGQDGHRDENITTSNSLPRTQEKRNTFLHCCSLGQPLARAEGGGKGSNPWNSVGPARSRCGEGPWQGRSLLLTVLGKDNQHRAALPPQSTNKPEMGGARDCPGLLPAFKPVLLHILLASDLKHWTYPLFPPSQGEDNVQPSCANRIWREL